MAYEKGEVAQDQAMISVCDDDIRFWSNALGCTEQHLREAVDAAGHSPTDVMEFLAPTGR